jgi:hypothetical protein
MDIISAIEGSGFATWVRESPSLFAYTGILSLHAMGLAVVVGLNLAVALPLLGLAPNMPLRPARKFFPIMYAGFWVNALSGLALLAAGLSNMLSNPVFYVKMVLIVLAVVNLRLLRHYAFGDQALESVRALPGRVRLLAGSSLGLWAAAIIAGRLTAYPGMVSYYFG